MVAEDVTDAEVLAAITYLRPSESKK
jgi:hypothetical protein